MTCPIIVADWAVVLIAVLLVLGPAFGVIGFLWISAIVKAFMR